MSRDGFWRDLETLLVDATARHGVAGCGLAVSVDGELHELVAGVSDVRTGEPMRTDAPCLVGSTTKVYTTTLLMKLVEERGLDLDEPVRTYLPGFRLASEEATAALTTRHLLSHTAGIGPGGYDDHGRGEDAVARYVEALSTHPSVHLPGERWGYSNAGFVIAGRLVEVLTGRCWDDALREMLLSPAGLSHTLTLPEDLLLRPIARPHVVQPDGTLETAPMWGLAGRSLGPTGSTLAATAGDLVRFARLHLNGGTTDQGTRILSEESVRAMQVRQTDVPDGWPYGDGWCLGWLTANWDGQRVVAHAGHNLGAGSHVVVLPDLGAAVSMVFNSVPGDAGLQHEVVSHLVRELFGITKPEPWLPLTVADAVPDLRRYAGRYVNNLVSTVIEVDGSELVLHRELQGPAAGVQPSVRMRFLTTTAFGSGDGAAHAASSPQGYATPEIFFGGFNDAGTPGFLYESVFVAGRQDDDRETAIA
jgi:CubicO group peptidase (beta-lactamase class C family)